MADTVVQTPDIIAEANKMIAERREVAQKLARHIYNRMIEQGYKGKKRDTAALDMWLGAAALADTQGQKELLNYLLTLACFELSMRGFGWLEKFITEPPPEQSKAA